jgi:exosortase
MTLVLLAIGAGLFLWAHLTRATDLLFPSLASTLLAFASGARGRAGCRAILLPALVLLLGLRIPAPLNNELVWHLQLWTASGAAWVMTTIGYDVVVGDVLLRSGGWTFLVIESCSGLQGIQILTLVAVLIRDLLAASGARQWLLVLVAPWLGYAANVVRVVVIVVAVNAEPEAFAGVAEDHTSQGVAVLIGGTAILYALGWGMAGRGRRRAAGKSHDGPRLDRTAPAPRWRSAAAWLLVLGVLSVTVSPFPRDPTQPPSAIEIPQNLSGWSGERLPIDQVFLGRQPQGQALHRRYEKQPRSRPPEVVDLFVSFEIAGWRPGSSLFTSKIALPGSDWSIEENARIRVSLLGLDADLAVASREFGSERALVYSWRLRDEGIWRESLRSLLALESGPFRRERRRAVVRLTTPLPHDGPVARDRAKQILDRFIRDFRDELAGL